MHPCTQDILAFWFGSWPFDEKAAQSQASVWFQSTPELDETIKQRFQALVESALKNNFHCDCLEDDLAYIILLDQFTRNIYRGQGKAFSGDQLSLNKSLKLIEKDTHLTLPLHVATFACMPLQHSEDPNIHKQSIAVFTQLVNLHGEAAQGFLTFAHKHKDIIDQFTRYPHRNDALNRDSTEQEKQYLANNGLRFGQ
ncbi:DUF924 family protein [Bermanella sp. WJH001]|uniref:DUF924 family protein n=1 Tax=Bermanella sp. WJH001 TaxID=3048005 RepID=UPI0024BE4F6F|nr:DUF924 family protein [Bermanella sp. WJH001]MDJ1537297.1 DUF924 family protein [Bermanella sp. WJH001]